MNGARGVEERFELKLKIPGGEFGAYLFDCDGTVVDSMPLHYLAWQQALAEWKCDFSEEIFYAWGGMPVAEVIGRLNRERGLQIPVPELIEHINAMYGKIPLAVVSGSTRESVVKSLEATKLMERFNSMVCAG